MSTIPDSTREAAHYIREATGGKAAISVRAARSAHGYHAGKAEIFGPNGSGWKDYSVRKQRDKDGLSNASAAMDISRLGTKKLKELLAYMVKAKSSGVADIQEVIGPGPDGRAYQYGWYNNWKGQIRPKGDSHEWHVHVSFPRDTEFGDRKSMFVPFFGTVATPLPPVDEEVEQPVEEPSVTTEFDMVTVISAQVGYDATIKKNANVRSEPRLDATKIRKTTSSENWKVVATVEGEAYNNSEEWVMRLTDSGQWEFVHSVNVAKGPSSPVEDTSELDVAKAALAEAEAKSAEDVADAKAIVARHA